MAITNIPALHKKFPKAAYPLLALLILLLSSCSDVTSIYPLQESKQDCLFLNDLAGVWTESTPGATEGEYVEVQLREDSLYHLKVVHKSYDSLPSRDTSYLFATLVQVDNYLFLDCEADPDHLPANRNGQYALMSLYPGHFICRIKFRNNNQSAEIHYLQDNNLEEVLKSKGVAYYKLLWDITLLEPSADLKKLMVQLAKEHPKEWAKKTLVRKSSPPLRPGRQV